MAGSYHRGPQHYRNIGLIGNGIGNTRLPHMPALASIATTAAVAMPRNNYINRVLRPYQNVMIPMSPYFWSSPRSGLHRGNDYYRGLGSVTTVGKNQQQLFGGLIPKKTRKIVIDRPGRYVSQSFIRGPNTHCGNY
ncbi:unnamed protein product [Macrosiphum euphorbiae]|uniref:Uncharacterized protein n=1 Tax=Macrosiphum euphorbiae TaxID=13131 RepID=A0AAV0W1C7_9HEMI|nr:unnamed protein product [Macrosiphum euphorbiae]